MQTKEQIILRCKMVGYNKDVLRQTACLVVNLNQGYNVMALLTSLIARR